MHRDLWLLICDPAGTSSITGENWGEHPSKWILRLNSDNRVFNVTLSEGCHRKLENCANTMLRVMALMTLSFLSPRK